MSCTFCSIISGSLPSAKIHEDETVLSFLDIRQSNEGHILAVPKSHAEYIWELDDATAGALMRHIVRVTTALEAATLPDGINIWQSNRAAAGQEIGHVHFHIFPRFSGDRHFRIYPSPPTIRSVDELERIAAVIRAKL